jgi:excisionase family DNA binding protein
VSGRLLTAVEVAEQLAVASETVLRWARDGRLPAIYLSGRAVRFRESALEAWLAEREGATPERGRVTTQAGRRPHATVAMVTTRNNDDREDYDAG